MSETTNENPLSLSTDKTPDLGGLIPPGENATSTGSPPSESSVDAVRKAMGVGGGQDTKKLGRPPTTGAYVGGKRPSRAKGANGLSLAKVDNGPGPASLEKSLPGPGSVDFEAPAKPFDKEAAEKAAPFVIELLEMASTEIRCWRISRKTKDPKLGDFIAPKLGIADGTRRNLESSLVMLAEKYGVDLKTCPEWLFFSAFGFWQFQESRKIKTLLEEYLKLTGQAQP